MKDKVIVITGASSGIGKALAIRFAQAGCRLVITGRNSDKLMETAQQVKNLQTEILPIIADVSSENDCKRVIDETIKKFNRIDVLINNAGISMRGLLNDTNLEVLKTVMDTNFWGTVYCTKFALPFLLDTKGSVVGVSSIAGKKGLPGRCAYSSSKFAMEGFLETIRTENLIKGLHVLVACPGFTSSGIRNASLGADGLPQGESPRDEQKMMTSEEVASHIFHAVRKRKRDLVLTFNGRITILLNKFFPGFMDKIVYKFMAKEPGSPFR